MDYIIQKIDNEVFHYSDMTHHYFLCYFNFIGDLYKNHDYVFEICIENWFELELKIEIRIFRYFGEMGSGVRSEVPYLSEREDLLNQLLSDNKQKITEFLNNDCIRFRCMQLKHKIKSL